MSKPVSEWDEDYILSLPKENDEFDRKGAMLLDLKAGADENAVLNELAKQLSAFANTGGGKIIYGVEDDGSVKLGGVTSAIRSGGTKEWLERKIPGLTEYEILGFAVHEFTPKSPASRVAVGKALYVIDIPDSERAPHQSVRDKKYYIRNGSQSVPARHKIIEDIRNRQKHPNVSLGETKVEVQSLRQEGGTNTYAVDTILTLTSVNNGKLKCPDTFLLVKLEHGKFIAHYDGDISSVVRGTKPDQYLWRLNQPLPPRSEIGFRAGYNFAANSTYHPHFGKSWTFAVQNGAGWVDDLGIEWTLFADSAPVKTGRVTMREIGVISALNTALLRLE